ncbi:MAG: DinB family protein [Pseudomonadota bacterium]
MITPAYVAEMAAYSRWQNDTVYGLCDAIGQEERLRDRGLFFKSIHQTLDHICMINRSILTFLDGTRPERVPLDQMVWPDWEDLKAIRLEQDDVLTRGGRDWTEDWLSETIVMRSPRFDDPPSFPRWVMVVQIFNHQTHHRSQVTSALHAMGIDYGATDIPWRPGAGYFAG